jgi:hypothetical protein
VTFIKNGPDISGLKKSDITFLWARNSILNGHHESPARHWIKPRHVSILTSPQNIHARQKKEAVLSNRMRNFAVVM